MDYSGSLPHPPPAPTHPIRCGFAPPIYVDNTLYRPLSFKQPVTWFNTFNCTKATGGHDIPIVGSLLSTSKMITSNLEATKVNKKRERSTKVRVVGASLREPRLQKNVKLSH